ncbi:MAG: histidine--tRNA ligase [Gammaproteobacteria bacterium]|nr:histidine--tRNA ligase [Gammaproteobacteria bacterium]
MKIQAVRGMQDLVPDRRELFRYIEDVVRETLGTYGYREIGLPVIESTHLFQRLVGEATDIVEKEMYTFDDRSGDSITLRPEGTAGCARAALGAGMVFNQVQRLWYSGPMFRYERPQKGRYRQFEQIGVECYGMPGPDVDCELLLMLSRVWKALGIDSMVKLELNSIGSTEARGQFKDALVGYLRGFERELDADSQRRLTTNPMRILDSKDERTQAILVDAPSLEDYLDDASVAHFDAIRAVLDRAQVPYIVNRGIVRGLDYYNKTVFEWTTDALGAQGTVCGGGRYDGLIEELGGRPTPGVGFAMGLDRLAMLVETIGTQPEQAVADVYLESFGAAARGEAMILAESIRGREPALRLVVHCGDGKFKAQLKKADASGARVALILGEDEVARGEVGFKHLRRDLPQESVPAGDVVGKLMAALGAEAN